MSTIAELMLKIGAENSGLKKTLTDSKDSIKNTFSANPVDSFTNAIEGTTGSIGGLIGKFSSLAALAAGGFGFASLIENAVNAGNATYKMSQQLGLSAQESAQLSRVLSMSGSDVESFNAAVMRLDKNFYATGTSGDLCRDTLKATGVTLTDANGKMLPVTEQLSNMAQGYEKARASGQQQLFLMNTLGVKGLQLAKVFEDYNEKMKIASDVQGAGLDPEEMHKLSLEMSAMKMQASQVGLVFGSALAPLAAELFPPILEDLKKTSTFLKENKDGILFVTEEVMKLYAAYKAVGMAKSAINVIQVATQGLTGSNAAEKAAASELSAFQQKEIEKAVAASERGYLRKINAAVKAAQAESANADEAANKIAVAMAKISSEAEAASLAIRTNMTAAFTGAAAAAGESAAAINASIASTGAAATEAAAVKTAVTTESAVACASVVAESSAEQVTAIASTGTAAAEAATVKTEVTAESAVACAAAVVSSSEEQAGAIAMVGTTAEVTGEKQVSASAAAAGAADEVTLAQTRVTEAEIAAGNEALTAGAKMETASAGAATQVGILSGAVNLLRANWILVAYATYEAVSWLIRYQREQGKIKSYNKNAEVYYAQDANGVGHYYKMAWSEQATTDELGNYQGGYVQQELNSDEYQRQYEEDEKNRQMESGEYTPPTPPQITPPTLDLPTAGDYGSGPKGKSSKDTESDEQKAADKALHKEIEEANKFAEQINKNWANMYENKETLETESYQKSLDKLNQYFNDGLVSQEDYDKDLSKLAQIHTVNMIMEHQKQLDAERGYQNSALELAQKLQDMQDANLTGSAAAAAAFQKEWDNALRNVKKQVDDIVSSLNNMKNPDERSKAIKAYQDKGLMSAGDFTGKAVATDDLSPFASKAINAINTSEYQKQQDNIYTVWKANLDDKYNHGHILAYQAMLDQKQNIDHQYLLGQQAYMSEIEKLWSESHHTIYEDYAILLSNVDSDLESVLDKFAHGTASAADVFKSFAQSVIDSIIKIQAQAAAARITQGLSSLFNIGGSAIGTVSSMGASSITAGLSEESLLSVTPKFASGGIVTGPTLGMIGEAGYKEAVVPLTPQGMRSAGLSGGDVNIVVNNQSNATVTASDGGIDSNGMRQIIIDVAADGILDKASRSPAYARNMRNAIGVGG